MQRIDRVKASSRQRRQRRVLQAQEDCKTHVAEGHPAEAFRDDGLHWSILRAIVEDHDDVNSDICEDDVQSAGVESNTKDGPWTM